jgi:hypothetical protein
MMIRVVVKWVRSVKRWLGDTSGAATVETAVMMILLVMILGFVLGLWRVMMFKEALRLGVDDATRYLSENGRDIDLTVDQTVYQRVARELVRRRVAGLRVTDRTLSSLQVSVENPRSGLDFVTYPYDCASTIKEPRLPADHRFRVYASIRVPAMTVPFWQTVLGWRVAERATGFVECPRLFDPAESGPWYPSEGTPLADIISYIPPPTATPTPGP